jgi:hypothetical protein
MSKCADCELYRQAIAEITGTTVPADMSLAEVIELARDVTEKEAERNAPGWTRYELIKPVKGDDLYVLWVGSADGPAWVGTRAEAVAYGVTESKVRRADAAGTSARDGGHDWDSTGVIADQVGYLPRHLIGPYAKAVAGGECNAESVKFLEPFDDCPFTEDARPLADGELRTYAREAFTDEFGRLEMNGFILAKVDGQRVMVTAVSEPEHGMPGMVTVMRF